MASPPRLDLNLLLGRAHAALVAGDVAGARATLAPLLRANAQLGPALHLMALIEKKAGNREQASRFFLAALRALPANPQVRNNHGNFLGEIGEGEEAVREYRKAVELQPSFSDAWLNLGLTLQELGRLEEALHALLRATELSPASAKAWRALALLYRRLDQQEQALEALDQALALEPENYVASAARAEIALETGDAISALARYERARRARPDDLPAALGQALALHETGRSGDATALLEDLLRRHPESREGHRLLVSLRSQLGDGLEATVGIERALRQRPSDHALLETYLGILIAMRRHEEVVLAAETARSSIGPSPRLDLAQAIALTELGQTEKAEALLGSHSAGGDRATQIALVRLAFRTGKLDAADAALDALISRNPEDQEAWAYRATLWRLLEDSRHAWLCEQPGLYGAQKLGLDGEDIERIAEGLRKLHLARAHPFDQTLRGGTQTNGALFKRAEPWLKPLKAAIEQAVASHIDRLPPPDPQHPLLKHSRGSFRFSGSWSVRLKAQGFHVNHVHPAGWLSSACYISLPSEGLGGAAKAGWLALGAPPEELGLELEPIDLIEPRVGKLALFPSYLWHGTVPFHDGERLSVAFDVLSGSHAA
jgi:Tfp pilus assembly protein PilF